MIFTLQVPLKKKTCVKIRGRMLVTGLAWGARTEYCRSVLFLSSFETREALMCFFVPSSTLRNSGICFPWKCKYLWGTCCQLQLRDNFKLLVVRCQDPWDMETSAFWLRLKVGGHVPECLRGCFGGREKAHRNKHPLLQANVLGPL